MECEEIKWKLLEWLDQGVITYPCESLMVLVKNKDGTWSMCIEYRVLKKININN